jgi:hypothetical protein
VSSALYTTPIPPPPSFSSAFDGAEDSTSASRVALLLNRETVAESEPAEAI